MYNKKLNSTVTNFLTDDFRLYYIWMICYYAHIPSTTSLNKTATDNLTSAAKKRREAPSEAGATRN